MKTLLRYKLGIILQLLRYKENLFLSQEETTTEVHIRNNNAVHTL